MAMAGVGGLANEIAARRGPATMMRMRGAAAGVMCGAAVGGATVIVIVEGEAEETHFWLEPIALYR